MRWLTKRLQSINCCSAPCQTLQPITAHQSKTLPPHPLSPLPLQWNTVPSRAAKCWGSHSVWCKTGPFSLWHAAVTFPPCQPAVQSLLVEEMESIPLPPPLYPQYIYTIIRLSICPLCWPVIPVSWPLRRELIHRTRSDSISWGNIKDANLRLSPRGTDCFFHNRPFDSDIDERLRGKCRADRLLGFNLPAVSPNPNELHLSAVSRRIWSCRSIQACQATTGLSHPRACVGAHSKFDTRNGPFSLPAFLCDLWVCMNAAYEYCTLMRDCNSRSCWFTFSL